MVKIGVGSDAWYSGMDFDQRDIINVDYSYEFSRFAQQFSVVSFVA
jgi:hypothetical protein